MSYNPNPGGGAALTAPPAAASLTGVNVTTATIADSGGLWVKAPNIASTDAQLWVKSLAAGAYTWIVKLELLLLSTSFTAGGLALRESAGGKILTFEQFNNGATGVDLIPWTDANSRGANVFTVATAGQIFPWMKIHDDGTNRTYSVGQDGLNWIDLYSEARATFLGVAPNQAGVFACASGGPTGMIVSSWGGV